MHNTLWTYMRTVPLAGTEEIHLQGYKDQAERLIILEVRYTHIV